MILQCPLCLIDIEWERATRPEGPGACPCGARAPWRVLKEKPSRGFVRIITNKGWQELHGPYWKPDPNKWNKTLKAKTVKEVLIAVEWILDHYDWTQGAFYKNKDGQSILLTPDVKSVCLVGAVEAVQVPSIELLTQAKELLRQTISHHSVSVSLTVWNDTKGRTKKQVLAVVRKAIRKAT